MHFLRRKQRRASRRHRNAYFGLQLCENGRIGGACRGEEHKY